MVEACRARTLTRFNSPDGTVTTRGYPLLFGHHVKEKFAGTH